MKKFWDSVKWEVLFVVIIFSAVALFIAVMAAFFNAGEENGYCVAKNGMIAEVDGKCYEVTGKVIDIP